MSFRFRKSVKLAPGIRMNFSRSGVSTTFGGRGMSVNVGRRGAYLNSGIPGTGFHSRSRIGGGGQGRGAGGPGNQVAAGCGGCGAMGILLLLFLGFCGALIDSSGNDSGTPSLSTAGSTYSSPAAATETMYVHGRLNIRSGAGTSYTVVRTLSRGEAVEVGPGDPSGWAPVYEYGRQTGYVYRASRSLRADPPAARTRTRAYREPRGHPSGASARCRDGTYSYSAHRRGTCSHHGGVSMWL